MKLGRLLRVPRTVRTIDLVINIPEPAVPPATVPPSPKLTVWARTWAVLKVAGPASVATAAIIISILSLQAQSSADRDQQLTNAAAAGSTERHDAEQVSFLQNYAPQSPLTSLIVENFATTPVYFVTFEVQAAVITGIGVSFNATRYFTVYLGQIPACSSGTVNIVPTVMDIMQKIGGQKASQIRPNKLFIGVNSMYFADSNGLDWQFFDYGDLQQVASLPKFNVMGSVQATYRNAAGCV